MIRLLVLATALLAFIPPVRADLYQKVNGQFVLLSAGAEAAARADPTSLFSNDSGYPVLLGSADAAAVKAQWAAAAQQVPPAPGPTAASIAAALVAKGLLTPSDLTAAAIKAQSQ